MKNCPLALSATLASSEFVFAWWDFVVLDDICLKNILHNNEWDPWFPQTLVDNVHTMMMSNEKDEWLRKHIRKKIMTYSTLMFQNAGFVTALEYSDIRKMVFRISTGSAELEWAKLFN